MGSSPERPGGSGSRSRLRGRVLQSNAAAVGIKLNLNPKPFNDLGAGAGNCVVAKLPCNWDMASFGNGWSYSPDFLPTGDEVFLCGAINNWYFVK